MRHDDSTTVYQDCMRSAALAFLTRHQFQYLPNDPLLLERAVIHLESALEVAPVTARKLAEQAYSELDVIRSRHRLDLSNSSPAKSVIVDPSTGSTWAIPISVIYERIIAAPDNARFITTFS